jgi:hypothetical protein
MGGRSQHWQSTEVAVTFDHGVPVCKHEMLGTLDIFTMGCIVPVICLEDILKYVDQGEYVWGGRRSYYSTDNFSVRPHHSVY